MQRLDAVTSLGFVFVRFFSDLSDNHLRKMPSDGLETVQVIRVTNNPDMRSFPAPAAFPHVMTLRLAYAFHCCAYRDVGTRDPALSTVQENITFLHDDTHLLSRGGLSNVTAYHHNNSAYVNARGKTLICQCPVHCALFTYVQVYHVSCT